MAGRLVLVVGPSGAGKDTLINGARTALAGDPRFVFVRRVVTRQADRAEDHDHVSEAEFMRLEAAGQFVLSWRAHGLSYGLPVHLTEEIEAGRLAVGNVSRAVIAAAKAKYPGTAVIAVDAATDVRAKRLAGRGRESGTDIAARLARDAALPNADARVDNSGSVEDGIERFIAALRAMARH